MGWRRIALWAGVTFCLHELYGVPVLATALVMFVTGVESSFAQLRERP